ncbi:MAG: hypothetical protein ACOYMF_14825, partial [Bacteroidales bacterium]
DEQIIKAIIKKAKGTQDKQKKAVFAFTLSKMTEQRKSVIPGRSCMNNEDSEKLFNSLVQPVLNELKEK